MSRRLLPWLLIPLASVAGYLAGTGTSGGGSARQVDCDRLHVAEPPGSSTSVEEAGVDEAAAASRHPERRERVVPATMAPLHVHGTAVWTASERIAQLTRSDGSITGTVVDVEGNAIAGVLVRAESDLPRELRFDDDRDDLDDRPTPPIEQALREQLGATAQSVESTRLDLMLLREVRTGEDGAFELTGLYDIEYDVTALMAGWAVETGSNHERWDVRPGAEIAFVAQRLATVTVELVGHDGRPVQRASVFVSDDPDDDPFTYEYLSRLFTWTPGNRTVLVPPGERSFRARDGSRSTEVVRTDVADGDVVSLRLAPRAPLSVELVLDDGAPDIDVVKWRARLAGRTHEPVDGELATADGSVWFGDVGEGTWTVTAGLGRNIVLGSVEVDASSTEDDDAVLHVGPPPPDRCFRIVVLGRDGRPAENAEVGVLAQGDARVETFRSRPGVWTVVRDDEPNDDEIFVQATLGEDELTETVAYRRTRDLLLRFPERIDLVVEVPERVHSLAARTLDRDGEEDASPDDITGNTIAFHGLEPGRYELRYANAIHGGSMVVNVPTGGPVQFRPEPYTCYRVAWIDDESTGFEAGLRAGDYVVGIDGTKFRSLLHMDALRAAAMLRDQVVLDVVRGGRKLPLKCSLRQMAEDEAGAYWEPAVGP